jgi:hypothetical protein
MAWMRSWSACGTIVIYGCCAAAFFLHDLPWRRNSAIALTLLLAAGATLVTVLRQYTEADDISRWRVRRGSPRWVLLMMLISIMIALEHI